MSWLNHRGQRDGVTHHWNWVVRILIKSFIAVLTIDQTEYKMTASNIVRGNALDIPTEQSLAVSLNI